MGPTHQTPLTANLGQAAQPKSAKTTRVFALANHRFHDHFAPGLQGAPLGSPPLRCHARLGSGGRLSLLSLQDMVSLTARRHRGLKPWGVATIDLKTPERGHHTLFLSH